MSPEKAAKLAHYEISWWKAHHRKQKEELITSMTKLYVLQFDIDEAFARRAVHQRVIAADWHDQAEAFEDAGKQQEADACWARAEECLQRHFSLLGDTN